VHETQGHRAVGFVVVHGISDMPHAKAPGAAASTAERDGWKVTASRNAARFLAHLVATAWPLPPRGGAHTAASTDRTAQAVSIAAPASNASARDTAGADLVAGAVPVSTSSAHASAPARPVPVYPDAEVQALSERLEDARARGQKLRAAGLATDHVNREILELRRQLREGGQLRAGDALGDGRYLLVKVVGRGGFAVV
jgi:hypothetical protein